MGHAEDCRKRATKLDKSIKGRNAKQQKPMIAKRKALRDMAYNEEWWTETRHRHSHEPEIIKLRYLSRPTATRRRPRKSAQDEA